MAASSAALVSDDTVSGRGINPWRFKTVTNNDTNRVLITPTGIKIKLPCTQNPRKTASFYAGQVHDRLILRRSFLMKLFDKFTDFVV